MSRAASSGKSDNALACALGEENLAAILTPKLDLRGMRPAGDEIHDQINYTDTNYNGSTALCRSIISPPPS